MFDFLKHNFMTDCRDVGKTYKPSVVAIWFLDVFIVTFITIKLLKAISVLIWMLNVDEYSEVLKSFDLGAIGAVVRKTPDWLMLVYMFTLSAQAVYPMLFCKLIEKRPLWTMGLVKKNAVIKYLIGYAVGIAMICAALALASIGGNMQIQLNSNIPVVTVILYFFAYIVQGAGEEILCRGFLMISLARSIKGKHATWIAIAVSSVLFALLHVFNNSVTFLAIVNILLCGVLFAVYIVKTGNIWGACAAHSAWNFFQGNILGVQVSGIDVNSSVFSAFLGENVLVNGGEFGLEGGLAVTLVMVLSIAVIILLPIRNRREENENIHT